MTSFAVHLDAADTETFLALMQALGCATPDALLRVALWNQARVSGIEVPARAFTLKPTKRPA